MLNSLTSFGEASIVPSSVVHFEISQRNEKITKLPFVLSLCFSKALFIGKNLLVIKARRERRESSRLQYTSRYTSHFLFHISTSRVRPFIIDTEINRKRDLMNILSTIYSQKYIFRCSATSSHFIFKKHSRNRN